MRFFVSDPLKAISLINRVRPEDYLVSIVCVLRARLAVNGICAPLSAKKQPGPRKSEAHDDGAGNSPRFGGDLAPFKPRTDVTVMGSAHVPGRQKATSLAVTFGVNDWRKTLDVIGDRDLVRDEQVSFSPPEPFSCMPLRLENTFGGLKSPANPWGKGYGILADHPGARLAACNIHPAGHRHLDWRAQIVAPAFGPLPPNRPPRARLRGTYGEAWLYKRNPLPPEDFDWGFHNVAPQDQQFSPYLAGDETLHFEHFHPEHPAFSSRLPGLRLRVLVRRAMEAEGTYQIEELRHALDSVHVDTDAMTVDLGWRAVTRALSKDAAEITHAYIATEALSDEPQPLAAHVEAFEAQRAPRPIRTPPPPKEAPPPEEAAEDEEEQLVTLKAAIERMPFKAPFKEAVAAAQTSQELRDLVAEEGKRVSTVLEKAKDLKR